MIHILTFLTAIQIHIASPVTIQNYIEDSFDIPRQNDVIIMPLDYISAYQFNHLKWYFKNSDFYYKDVTMIVVWQHPNDLFFASEKAEDFPLKLVFDTKKEFYKLNDIKSIADPILIRRNENGEITEVVYWKLLDVYNKQVQYFASKRLINRAVE